MSKYRNDGFYQELEQELEELEHQPEKEPDIEDDKPKTVEEQTWKKRYSDLRRHEQDKTRELTERIKALETQLTQSVNKEIEYPKTQAEVEEWLKKFPDVGGMIKTLAAQEALKIASKADERFKTIEEREAKTAWEKEYNKLMAAHPDFDELRVSDEFIEWVQSKPRAFTEPLRGNDGLAAAEVISVYKREKQPVESKKKPRNDAAQSVPRGGRTELSDTKDKNLIYESDVAEMDHFQMTKMSAAIDKAMQEGRFVYDLSAA